MVGDVVVRIVRSDGEEYTLGNEPWRIPNEGLEDFNNLSYDVTSDEIPSYDGAIITSKRVSAKDRTIKAVLNYSEDQAAIRAEAIRFFNPKYSYTCYVTYLGRTRHCEGEQIGFMVTTGNIYKKVELTWTILCPNPYMLDADIFGKDLTQSDPRFGFPWVSFLPPAEGEPKRTNVGFITGYYKYVGSASIVNDGDVPSGIRMIISATDTVVKPYVTVGNKGRFEPPTATMKAGDKFELDASVRPPKVLFNGKNAIGLAGKNSNILDMVIDPGVTKLSYGAQEGSGSMHVTIYYNKQYLGI